MSTALRPAVAVPGAAAADVVVRTAAVARARLDAIDLLRGVVMVLMVLDHARDFLSAARFDPLDLDHTTTALFLTRWITHFCAPVFVFLAGVSAFLSGAQRPAEGRAARSAFLLSRGLWLVLLEVTAVNLAWSFNLRFESGVFLQVIWAIGASMVALAGLLWLPTWAVGVVGATLIAAHDAFDGLRPEALGSLATLWAFLHVQGPQEILGVRLFVVYPILAWVGVMAAGYAFGGVFHLAPERRRAVLLGTGSALVLLFVALRATGLYGDPRPWSPDASSAWRSALSFLDAAKYPPSLCYVAMTLGPALLGLAALERVRGPLARFLTILGRVPLFFYVLHLYLVHGLGMLGALAQGFPAAALAHDFRHLPSGYGFGLPVVYAGWLVTVALLFRPARWFAEVKRRSRSRWLSYL